MRILAIRGRNLASLAGEFEVDLEGEPLGGAGLFAITGPVGSGKTTILDAACLALFARTPRMADRGGVLVGHAAEVERQQLRSNDARGLMSRGSAECWAEVDFVGRDGDRYRATWGVRRARERAAGRLQKHAQRLTLVRDGSVLGGTNTETLVAIEDALGLSFEQFCRSVLLAQNAFASFLDSRGPERAELLERMTGTRIYGELSIAAHLRAKDERGRLDLCARELGSLAVLDPAERVELDAEAAELEETRAATAVEGARLEREVVWHERAAALADRTSAARREVTAADTGLEGAADELELLEQVERAWPLRAEFAAHERTLGAAQRLERDLEEATEAEAGARRRELRAISRLGALEDELSELGAVAREDRTQRERALDQLAARVAHARGEHDAALERETIARRALERFGELGERLDQLGGVRQELESIDDRLGVLDDKDSEHVRWQDAGVVARAECERARAAGQAAEDASGTAAGRLDEARRALSAARLTADLGDHRHRLVDGEPCPLCGAREHPYSGDAEALSELVASHEARVDELQRDLQALAATRASERAQERAQQDEMARVEEGRRACERASDLLRAQIASTRVALASLAPPADLSDSAGRDWLREQRAAVAIEWDELKGLELERKAGQAALASASSEVRSARESWLAADDERRDAERQLRAVEDAIERLSELQDELSRQRGVAPVDQSTVATERALDGVAPRPEDDPAEAWPQAVGAARRTVRAAGESRARRAEKRSAEAARAVEIAAGVERQRELVDTGERAIRAALVEHGFTREELSALVQRDQAWLDACRMRRDELLRAAQDARTRLIDRTAQLEAHAAERSSERTAGEAAAERAAHRQVQDRALERARDCAVRIREDDRARARVSECARALDEARARAAPWLRLAEVIGSADGKRFRSYAQGLTFRCLLACANRHLDDLAPRYELMQVPTEDLELQVVDRDMGDEVRSANTLSGGERFLVALALALGLADLSATRTRIETLFIDEGFGTLDPQSLETVLASLDALQARGYRIGVISHVPGLAERIGTKVVLEPVGGGRSRIRFEPEARAAKPATPVITSRAVRRSSAPSEAESDA